MSYQEEEQAKVKRRQTKQAITLAMEGQWQEAIAVNKDLLVSFPDDVDAYNRLGKAYMEVGDYSQAKEAYEHAMELDSFNTIAKKNLQRLAQLAGVGRGGAISSGSPKKVNPNDFIEEVDKAGVVNLNHLAPPEMLARIVAGDRVSLKVGGSNLIVETGLGEYLGQVEPKHAQRLIRLMEGGNRYSAAVVSSNGDKITVIIKETYQDPSQVGKPSFPPRRFEPLRPFVSDRLFRRGLDYEDEMTDESGYAMVSEEVEPLLDELPEIDDAADDSDD